MPDNIHKIISKHIDKYVVYTYGGRKKPINYLYSRDKSITKIEYDIYNKYNQSLCKLSVRYDYARQYS